jgi:hypothetical protein
MGDKAGPSLSNAKQIRERATKSMPVLAPLLDPWLFTLKSCSTTKDFENVLDKFET